MLFEWIDPQLDNKSAFLDQMYIDPVLSYNNEKLAVTHKGNLEIIDIKTKQISYVNPIKNYSWSPDNQCLIYSTAQGEIYIYILHPDEDDIPCISWIYICKGKYPAWSPF
jgi:hypothetical protein